MFGPAGSVYLDNRPRSETAPAPAPTNLVRSRIAATLAAVGLVGLTLAVVITGLRTLVLDADPVIDAFEATLEDPAGRAELEREISTAIEHGFLDEQLVAEAVAQGVDVAAEADRVAALVLDDSSFTSALIALVTEIHARAFVAPGGDLIDLQRVSAAVEAVIARESPSLAERVPPGATLWVLDARTIPDLTAPIELLDRVRLFALVAALAVPAAFAVHPRRHRVTGWVGRWALVAGLLGGLLAVGLPHLGRGVTGSAIVEIAVRATSLRLIAPSMITGIVGMGLVSVAAVARRHEARLVSDEGAAVALGMHEPPPWRPTAGPVPRRPSRELVDVEHPLTNT